MYKPVSLTAPLPRWRPRLKPGLERNAPEGLQTPSSGSHTELWGQSLSWRSGGLCRPSQTSPASEHNTEKILFRGCHILVICLILSYYCQLKKMNIMDFNSGLVNT